MLAGASLLLGCLLLVAPGRAAALGADGLDVRSLQESVALAPYSEVQAEPPDERLQFEDVRGYKWQEGWKPEDSSGLIGLTDQAHWVRATLQNTGAEARDVVLRLRLPFASLIEFYTPALDGSYTRYETSGDAPSFEGHTGGASMAFPVTVSAGSAVEVFMRVQNPRGGILIAPVRVWDRTAFQAHQHLDSVMQGLFFGALLILSVFNLGVFVVTRERSYGYLVGLLMSNAGYQLASWGLGDPDLWFVWTGWTGLSSVAVLQPAAGAFLLAFLHSFFDFSRTAPRVARSMPWMLGAFLLYIGITWWAQSAPVTLFVFNFVGTALLWPLVPAAMVARRAGAPSMWVVLTGVLIWIAGAMSVVASSSGLVPFGFLAYYGDAMGVLVMALLLSVAVGVRFREERQHREQAQNEAVLARDLALQVEREAAATLQNKVDERTTELADQTRVAEQARGQVEQLNARLSASMEELSTLFDGLRQGVFSFGPDLCIGGHWSVEAGRIFERAELEGVPVAELLLSGMPEWHPERDSLRQWLDLAFETPVEHFTELAQLAPSEFVFHPDTERETQVQLEISPIIDEGKLVQVLCLATDVTRQRVMEASEAENREMVELLRGLTDGGADMVAFLRSTQERLQGFQTLLEHHRDALTHQQVEELFRLAHTVKGEARLQSAREVEDAALRVEQQLQILRPLDAEALGQVDFADTLTELGAEALSALARLREQLRELSPVGEAIFDRTTVSQRLLHELLTHIEEASPQVRGLLEQLAAQPFGDSAARLPDAAATWAAERDKQVVVQVEGVEVPVPGKLARVLRGALTHLVRNAVAHGIEAPEARYDRGKDGLGSIYMLCEQVSGGVRITVKDDGAGLDIEHLRALAVERGLRWAEGQEHELIFADGLSTSRGLDDMSGRGVGMAAARADLRSAGYDLQVRWVASEGTRFEISPLVGEPHATHRTRVA